MPELEQALRAIGRDIAYPSTPQLAVVVGERIRAEPRRARFAWLRSRRLLVALAVLVLAVTAALAIPPARSALLRFFGLKGATIERVERRPVVDEITGRRLGVEVSLEEARAAVPFRLLAPAQEDVEVFLDRVIGAVTFRWDDRRLFLTEFRGETTPYVRKSAGPGTRIEFVEVSGGPGYWLAGEPHVVVFRDARGFVREARVAGNVLLWERGELTLRLEGAASKEEALRIAGTLRRAPV
jgi:hypothetical protein